MAYKDEEPRFAGAPDEPLGISSAFGGRFRQVPEEDETSFEITLPSSDGQATTVEEEGRSYRSLAKLWGLPSLSALEDTSPITNLEGLLAQGRGGAA